MRSVQAGHFSEIQHPEDLARVGVPGFAGRVADWCERDLRMGRWDNSDVCSAVAVATNIPDPSTDPVSSGLRNHAV